MPPRPLAGRFGIGGGHFRSFECRNSAINERKQFLKGLSVKITTWTEIAGRRVVEVK